MPPTLSWLDSSSASRRKAMEVIKLFEEKGTVDEIGIGSVRDALSDALFPGTSVLHTRARYFFIIPWIYQTLEAKRVPAAAIAKEARRLEVGLIDTILASEDSERTIGRVARAGLRQLPSTMYWSALHAWGLKPTDQSQDQYHRSLDRFYGLKDGRGRDDDGQALDGVRLRNWDAGLPPAPTNFPKCSLSLTLTRREAGYLHEQILTHCRGTLLAHLVDRCSPVTDVLLVWQHPESGGFPQNVQERLTHARNFSEVINGAALLYNIMLAERGIEDKQSGREEWAEIHGASYKQWTEMMAERREEHAAWDRERFWHLVLEQNPRIPLPTRTFVDTWLRLALAGNPATLLGHPQTRRLTSDRERAIKGRLARLHSPEALKRWGGSSGARQLDYRWGNTVSRVVADIQRGLSASA
ncbi:MAG: hypothetical protein IPJ95_06015 [Gemmatimonadetes bacterium]|nr:hypothetical protein [Gemmatimonadota bacterium]